MDKELKKALGIAGHYAIAASNASISGDKVKTEQEARKLQCAIGIVKICQRQAQSENINKQTP